MPYKDKNKKKEQSKKWYSLNKDKPEYKEKIKKASRKSYLKNKEKKLKISREREASGKRKEDHKKWRLNNPDKVKKTQKKSYLKYKENGRSKEWYLKKTYGMTLHEFNELLLKQNNSCGICNKKFTGVKPLIPNIDHVHDKTARIRGLLCGHCNSGIGLLHDDPHLIRNAIKWISKNKEKQ